VTILIDLMGQVFVCCLDNPKKPLINKEFEGFFGLTNEV